MPLSRFERTAWTSRLGHVPSWALEEELQRRGEAAQTDPVVDLPGLRVDPLANTVTWRGVEHHLTDRETEVLYALALSRASGRRRVRSAVVAHGVWRGFDERSAVENLRTYVHYLRKRLPGLIARRVKGTYELDLDGPAAALVESAAS